MTSVLEIDENSARRERECMRVGLAADWSV